METVQDSNVATKGTGIIGFNVTLAILQTLIQRDVAC